VSRFFCCAVADLSAGGCVSPRLYARVWMCCHSAHEEARRPGLFARDSRQRCSRPVRRLRRHERNPSRRLPGERLLPGHCLCERRTRRATVETWWRLVGDRRIALQRSAWSAQRAQRGGRPSRFEGSHQALRHAWPTHWTCCVSSRTRRGPERTFRTRRPPTWHSAPTRTSFATRNQEMRRTSSASCGEEAPW
jgi:hypothetical protein